ncbi:hypothetical protein MD484_g283, partial [Candolleomyces efflorescens]
MSFVKIRAVYIPADGTGPSYVSLPVSTFEEIAINHDECLVYMKNKYVPHPEVFMGNVRRDMGTAAWRHVMLAQHNSLVHPLVVFYPAIPEPEKTFEVNVTVRKWYEEVLQFRKSVFGESYSEKEERIHWIGDMVVVRCISDPRVDLTGAYPEDLATIKQYLSSIPYPGI